MYSLRSIWLIIGFFLTFATVLNAEDIYKYSYVPKKVYEHQLFPVTVIGINEKNTTPVHFTFDSSSKIQPLFKEPLIVRNGSDSFYTFYFQAKTEDIRVPSISISSDILQTSLPSKTIEIKTLQKRSDFCQVLAADMKIKSSQASNYDEKNHIVTLSIEAYEANMEDMNLSESIESGIDTLERHFSKVEAEFYIVVPVEQKQIKFTYFNTIKKQYVFLEADIIIEDASVTTQSELNPKEDNFEKLKKYTLITFSIFFLVMFLFKRDFFYLVFGVISFITLLTLYIPHKKICVKQGAPLYILPTQTSTVSTKIDKKLDTMLLGERTGYKKVEYKEGIIGWIKNEDLCEN